jgi:hypothetical protein
LTEDTGNFGQGLKRTASTRNVSGIGPRLQTDGRCRPDRWR